MFARTTPAGKRADVVSDPVALVAAGTSGFAALVAVSAHLRFRRLRQACSLLQGNAEGASFIVAVSRQTSEMERLRAEVNRLHREFDQFRSAVDESIRRVAVLRYDAFGEMGGQLSWSVALLDHHGDGLVMTTLVGRSDTRCYIKPMRRGVSDTRLSPEEIDVVAAAMRPARTARVPAPAAAPVHAAR